LERDIRTCAEFAEQVRYPSIGQGGSDVIEQLSRDQAELLGGQRESQVRLHVATRSQARHFVA
jgi:hypothetical protein